MKIFENKNLGDCYHVIQYSEFENHWSCQCSVKAVRNYCAHETLVTNNNVINNAIVTFCKTYHRKMYKTTLTFSQDIL